MSDMRQPNAVAGMAPFVKECCWNWIFKICAVCRRFEFCMSKVPRPDVTASTERLQVTASYARVRLSFGAPLMVALSGIRSTAFRVGSRTGCSSHVSVLVGCATDVPEIAVL